MSSGKQNDSTAMVFLVGKEAKKVKMCQSTSCRIVVFYQRTSEVVTPVSNEDMLHSLHEDDQGDNEMEDAKQGGSGNDTAHGN
jgi:hypothetical protein